jgi:hypothetical protein
MPKWGNSPYVVPNPKTKKPYRSILQSWEVAARKAGLPYLELEDLRYADLGEIGQEQLIELVLDTHSE